MSRSEPHSKCLCQNCGGRIEFPSEGAGRTIPCPHCNWPTVLAADRPASAARKGRKGIYRVSVIAAAITIAAGAAAYRYWYLPGRAPSSQNTPVTTNTNTPVVVVPVVPPDPWRGLMAGPVALEKVGDTHLVYAVGKLHNASDRQRFSVKVDLDVFDADKKKVGTATDYTPSIDPGKDWKFKALVTDRTAATAKLTSVKEN